MKKQSKSNAAQEAGSLDRLVRRWGKIEVRLNDDQTIDEIVARDVRSLHIEQMDDGLWWMGVEREDGVRLMVNFHTKRNAAIALNAESEDGTICEGFGSSKAPNIAHEPPHEK